jgi:small subunit ribosomal protein S13
VNSIYIMTENNQPKTVPAAPKFKHIVRIANVDVPGGKPVRVAMTNIKGIGMNFADAICIISNVNKQAKVGELSEEQVKKINDTITKITETSLPKWMLNRRRDYDTGEDKHLITGTLNFVKDNDIKRLKKIKSNRGIRHGKGLPLRGQRTRSNFRKSKGKVVGVKRKAAPGKSGK